MSFPAYPAYKDSGIEWLGTLPSHWRLSRMRFVTDCLDGKRVPLNSEQRADRQGHVPYWGANSIMDYVQDALFDEELALLGEDGAPFFDRTKPVAFHSAGPVWPNNHIHVLRPHSDVKAKYLVSILNITDYAQFIDGSTRDKLTQSEMNNIPVPLPPDAEQSAIITFLDRETAKIDCLVAEQQRLIELLQEKRQAVISHAVTKGLDPAAPMKDSGVEWLGEVPSHWDVTKIKYIKSKTRNAFVDGPFGSNLKSEHFVEGGDVFVIESGFATQGVLDVDELKTISLEHFRTIDRSEAKPGDIIIAKIGAQFGKSSILPNIDKPAVVSGNSLKLTVDPAVCIAAFVNWQLTNLKMVGAIDEIVNGTAQPALSLGEMNNLPILVPTLDEQRIIIGFLSEKLHQFEGYIADARLAIELLQERRAALISAAVTGKIDVHHLATAAAEAA